MSKITKVPNRDLYRAKVANPLLGHDNNGRVKRQVIYGKTADEVKQKITELEMEILNGRYVGVHNVTVGIYLSKWLEKHKKDLKPTTYSRYHDLIDKHIVPILGNTKLQGVTKAQVMRMYNVLLTEGTQHKTKRNFCPNGLSYRSVQQIHRVMSHACKDAIEDGLLKNNPCTGALPKRSREAAMQEAAAKNQFIAKYLDIENPTYRVNRTMEMNEITAFIEFLKITNSTMYFPALLTIGLGGLRRGELLAATWKQVFFDEKRFVVARSLSFTTEERLSVELPKSASSIRVVPIPDSLVTVMQQVKKEQAKRKLIMGGAYKDNDLIVCRNDGSFYNPNGFTCSWRKATRRFVKYTKENKTFMKKHGLNYPNYEYFTHHAMRSTLATFYKSCGMSDVVASKSLGHSSTQVTKDYYLSPIESELQKAATLLDTLIFKRFFM